jgi:hypothetical protein
VARRVSNFLKGGYAVGSFAELASARNILIRVPEASLERVVSEICNSDLSVAEHSFILCETWTPTEKLEPLRRLGAGIASIVALPAGREKTFVVEGDRRVVRQVRRMIEHANVRTIELRPGAKHLFFAAAVLCTAIPVPLLLMAQQALRDAGLGGHALSSALEEMSVEMLSGFLKGARMTWGGVLADSLKTCEGGHWDRLCETHPEVATKLRDSVNWSRGYMAPRLSREQSA